MPETSLLAITRDPLDVAGLIPAVQAEADRSGGQTAAAGALAVFVGVVRGDNGGRRVLRLDYEAYEPLALKALARIASEAREDWPEVVVAIHHRIGPIALGEASVVIVAASAHRAAAFAVSRFAIERLKQIAPIWKREYFEGGDVWIEGASADPADPEARDEARRRACA
jgi:molybdopterin synthase catalytic subunit